MAFLARGVHYFGARGFPVAVRRANCDGPVHTHDVTEREHYHDFSELVIVLGGSGQHLLEGRRFPVSAGDVFVLQGRQVHCFRERRGLRLLNVMYDPARLSLPNRLLRRITGYSALFLLEPTFRSAHQFSSRLHLNRSDLAAAEAWAHQIEEEEAQRSEGHEAALLSALLNLIVFVSRRYGESENTEARALLRIGQLISTLEQDYGRSWSIQAMAEATHLSRSSLMRTFQRATGQAPIEYLIGLRMEAAMRALQQSERSVTEIALATGFSDSNYFARQFRKTVGCTPSDFRRLGATARSRPAPLNRS